MSFNVHGRAFVVFLAAMTALPPLAIDMALPSLALIQADLAASQTSTAATIAIFLAGFSTAPLFVGPLADRFGRKPVLIVGLALFTLCGLGAALAPSIGALLGFRLVQGAGAGAVGILPRAIVRDLFDMRESRLFITAIAQVNGVAPVVAPTLGALILYVAPWRTIYLALAAIGVTAARCGTRALSRVPAGGRSPEPQAGGRRRKLCARADQPLLPRLLAGPRPHLRRHVQLHQHLAAPVHARIWPFKGRVRRPVRLHLARRDRRRERER